MKSFHFIGLIILLCGLTSGCAFFRVAENPKITTITAADNQNVVISFQARKGSLYIVEKSQTLLTPDWKPVGGIITSQTDSVTLHDQTLGLPAAFYRVRKLTP